MSIESGHTVAGHKPVGGVDSRGGKKPGKADSATGDAGSGFAMLMGMLSAADSPTEAAITASNADTAAPGSLPNAPLNYETNMPADQSGSALAAIYFESFQNAGLAPPAQVARPTAGLDGLTLDANGSFQRGMMAAATPLPTMSQATTATATPTMSQATTAMATPTMMPASVSGNAPNIQSNSPPGLMEPAQAAINIKPTQTPATAEPPLAQPSRPLSGLTLDANGSFQRGMMAASTPLPTMSQTTTATPTISQTTSATATPTMMSASVSGNAPNFQSNSPQRLMETAQAATNLKSFLTSGGGVTTPPDANAGSAVLAAPDRLSPTTGASQMPGLSAAQVAAQAELRDARAHPSTLDLAARTDVGSTLAAVNGAADSVLRAQERSPARSSAQARSGDASDGAFGAAAGINARADAPYAIEASAAAVPDTAIAETVSYWVTQGIQSAELTLDGFGDDPVAVSISLNGDQAQIEFRTDQADVRQALESATTELRDLLSGEGLQLAGVSVGTSGGRSAQHEARQQSPASRAAGPANEPTAAAPPGRSSHPTVGRSLDLFV